MPDYLQLTPDTIYRCIREGLLVLQFGAGANRLTDNRLTFHVDRINGYQRIDHTRASAQASFCPSAISG